MRRWADRKLGRMRGRSRGRLVSAGAPRPQASVASGLKSEPLIPRRGGWNPRRSASAAAGPVEAAEGRTGEEPGGANAARVRWNLSA
jgi:hypothetical protein